LKESYFVKRLTFFLAALATLGGVVAFRAPASGQTDAEAAPSYGIKIPPGYRDWRLISVAHEEGNLNSFAAILGNDVAVKAYREGKLPFPDGAIITALHYGHVPSEENNKVFGRPQSFVAGTPTNIQFMVKDSKVRQDGRLGVRSLQRRQTRRRGVDEYLLPLPQSGQSWRSRLHPLRTVIFSLAPRLSSAASPRLYQQREMKEECLT
jgi:hypothetical protein